MEQLGLGSIGWEWRPVEVLRTRKWHVEVVYTLVQTEEALADLVAALVPRDCSYDTETSGLHPRLGARIAGHVAAARMARDQVRCWYVPVRHFGGENDTQRQLPVALVNEAFREVLAQEDRTAMMHHSKFDVNMLRADDVPVRRKILDSAVCAPIANENEESFSLKRLAERYCLPGSAAAQDQLKVWMRQDAQRLGLPFDQRRPDDLPTYLERFGYARSPIQLCGYYGCRDAFYTLYLCAEHYAGVVSDYAAVTARDHRTSEALGEMEWNGLPLDVDAVRRAHDKVGEEVEYWLAQCRERTGNPGFEATDAELRTLFYVSCNMEPLRFTSGGRSKEPRPAVDAVARKLLAARYPEFELLLTAIGKLLRARKVWSTYTGSFLRYYSDETGRIYPSYNQLENRAKGGVPKTGRLASSEPNIQNVDAKGLHLRNCGCEECVLDPFEEPRPPDIIEIHDYFTVPPGMVRAYIDFSQIELKILAWLCQDPVLIDCFRNGLDVHAIIAEQLGIERKVAKQVNFGNSYGMQKQGLSLRLPGFYDDPEGTEAFAEEVLQRYFAKYKNILLFRRKLADEVRAAGGYMISPFGRPRRLPDICSQHTWVRERAERQMMSSMVSGMAADLMKESMVRCLDFLREQDAGQLVQSIHDELVFDLWLREGWSRVLLGLVARMEDWPQLSDPPDRQGVPIRVNVSLTTTTWGAKKALDIQDGHFSWAA